MFDIRSDAKQPKSSTTKQKEQLIKNVNFRLGRFCIHGIILFSPVGIPYLYVLSLFTFY